MYHNTIGQSWQGMRVQSMSHLEDKLSLISNRFDEACAQLAADNSSGASELYRCSVQLVLRVFDNLPDITPALENLWPLWLRMLLRAQPAMAPFYTLSNQIALEMEKKWIGLPQRVQALRDFLKAEYVQLGRPEESVADHVAGLIAKSPVVMTHSFSATVALALERAHAAGTRVRVCISESRPAGEGRRLAERLARAGIPVHFFVDDARALHIGHVDLLLLGADRVAERSFQNKIGSCAAALLAQQANVPTVIVSQTNKFWPRHLPMAIHGANSPSEVWSEPPQNVLLENPYFEEIDLQLTMGVVTERGLMVAPDIAGYFDNFPVAEFLQNYQI